MNTLSAALMYMSSRSSSVTSSGPCSWSFLSAAAAAAAAAASASVSSAEYSPTAAKPTAEPGCTKRSRTPCRAPISAARSRSTSSLCPYALLPQASWP